LGRQVQARKSQRVPKAPVLSKRHGTAGDRLCGLAMPDRSTVPNLGKKCGRRERESRRGGRRERSLRETHPPRVVTVKGILVFWMASLFAGRRRNGGLDRPDSVGRHPPLHAVAPMTADVRRTPRRGTSSACATKRMHPSQAREIVACARGRVLRSVLRPVHVNPHYAPRGASRRW
jgi:hypothetical protein